MLHNGLGRIDQCAIHVEEEAVKCEDMVAPSNYPSFSTSLCCC